MSLSVRRASELKFGRHTEFGQKLARLDPKPGELPVGRACGLSTRPAPVSVAKLWDDLRVGVISQSNLVIAGSPRNAS